MSVLKYKDSDGIWKDLETNVVVQGEKYFVKFSFDMTKFNLDESAWRDDIPLTDTDKANLTNNPYNCVFILTDTNENDAGGHSQYVFYPAVNQTSVDSDNNPVSGIMFVCTETINTNDVVALGTPTYYGIWCEDGEVFITSSGKLSLELIIDKKVEAVKPQQITIAVNASGTLTDKEIEILKASTQNYICMGNAPQGNYFYLDSQGATSGRWYAYYRNNTGQSIYIHLNTDLTSWEWKWSNEDYGTLYRHRIVSSFGSPYQFELIWFDKKNTALTKDEILTVIINGENGATFYASGTGVAGSYCRMIYFKSSGKVQGQFINVSDGTLTKTFIDLAEADVTFIDHVYQMSASGGAGIL